MPATPTYGTAAVVSGPARHAVTTTTRERTGSPPIGGTVLAVTDRYPVVGYAINNGAGPRR
jgi:hypothetical protein